MTKAFASQPMKRSTSYFPTNSGATQGTQGQTRHAFHAHHQGASRHPGHDFSHMSVHADVQTRYPVTHRGFDAWSGVSPLMEGSLNVLKQMGPGGGTGGASPSTTPTFPTYAEIIANSSVSTCMTTAWDETKSATSRTSRREQGFWIKFDTASSAYTCAPTFTGPSIGPDETGAADPGTKPADSGTTYTVGLFHTHTPMTYRTGGSRGVGPSDADNRFHTSNGVVGIIYDYVESPAGSGSIPAGHPLNSAATTYHSGPNRRT